MIVLIRQNKILKEVVPNSILSKVVDAYPMIGYNYIGKINNDSESYLQDHFLHMIDNMFIQDGIIYVFNNVDNLFTSEREVQLLAAALNEVSDLSDQTIFINKGSDNHPINGLYHLCEHLEETSLSTLFDRISKDGLNEDKTLENIMDNLDAEDAYTIENILNSD